MTSMEWEKEKATRTFSFPSVASRTSFGTYTKKATRLGTSYQTLINSLVHRYLNGGVTINEAF